MSSLLDEPTDRRRRRTRNALLDAALSLFAERGYRQTSVDDLAERADVALSSIYANFPGGKADVYAALAHRLAVAHAEQMRARLAQPEGRSELAAFDEYVRFHRANPLAFRLLGLTDVDGSDSDYVGAVRAEIRAILTAVAADIVAASSLPPQEAEEQALLMWASVNGVLSLRAQGFIGDDIADRLIGAVRAEILRRLSRS
ncbi:TetR/AcrR family transcriptional regulator [Skermania sp. ID1734]|uniref:TetR/AcrR family transcriptional regulator n=1 Tax=Skermania sp. ID1734 TaxID=2597516 RepID=UPI00117E92BD|nr:TetR/AcrR family transcriptional regulator [Skermania sp. ID1734]TSE01065.1 TetR/AcrR family transcriptional regulator [Skermania sp. ID1734]